MSNMLENEKIFKISSKYLLEQIFSFLEFNYVLNLIKYNKSLQKKLNINLKNRLFSYEISTIDNNGNLSINRKFNCFIMLVCIIIIFKLVHFILIIVDIDKCFEEEKKEENNYFIEYYLFFVVELVFIIVFHLIFLLFFICFKQKLKIFYILDPIVYLILLILSIVMFGVFKREIGLIYDKVIMIFLSIIIILLVIKAICYSPKINEVPMKKLNMPKDEIEFDKKNTYLLTRYKGFKIDDFNLPIEFNEMESEERINFLKENEKKFLYSLNEDKIQLIELINKIREENNIEKLRYRKMEFLNDYFLIEKNKKLLSFKNSIMLDKKFFVFRYPIGKFKEKLINNDKTIMKVILFDYLEYILILEREDKEYILIYEYQDIPINTVHIYNNENETNSIERINKKK